MESPEQNYVTLYTGAKMPKVGLGLYMMDMKADRDLVVKSVTEVGYRHIDTAQFYENEESAGETFKQIFEAGVQREELFITTKLWINKMHDPVNSLKNSLEKMQLEYVDMYMIHFPKNEVDENGNFVKNPMHKVWAGMEECVELGLTKHIGISNFNVQLICDMLSYCNIKPA